MTTPMTSSTTTSTSTATASTSTITSAASTNTTEERRIQEIARIAAEAVLAGQATPIQTRSGLRVSQRENSRRQQQRQNRQQIQQLATLDQEQIASGDASLQPPEDGLGNNNENDEQENPSDEESVYQDVPASFNRRRHRIKVHTFNPDEDDVNEFVESFKLETRDLDLPEKLPTLMSALKGEAYSWFLHQRQEDPRENVNHWLRRLKDKFELSSNDKMRQVNNIKWRPGKDTPRVFLRNLKDKILRAKPDIQDYEVMEIMQAALQTHPNYRELCSPRFPRMLADLRLALESLERSNNKPGRSSSQVFSLEDAITSIVKQVTEAIQQNLGQPKGNSYKQEKQSNRPQNGKNRQPGNSASSKWCSFHRSTRHSDQECKAQRDQQKGAKSKPVNHTFFTNEAPEEVSSSSTDTTSSEN